MSERWTSLGLTLYSLAEGRELAACDFSGASLEVAPEEGDVLLSCAPLKTLEEHAAERPETLDLLRRAAAAGVLLSEAAIRAWLRPAPRPPAPSALGIVTKDRPDALARCLKSFRAPEVVVCDDSAIPPPLPRGVRYAGPAEKSAYLDALAAESGVPRAVAAFALGDVGFPGFRAGGNRNALTLDLAGRLFVAVDDDVLGRFARPDAPVPEPLLGGDDEDMDERVFPDRESALRLALAEEVDFLAEHGTLLGRSLAELPAPRFGDVGPFTLRKLRREGGFVALTMPGVFGDCGMGNASWLLTLRGKAIEELAGTDERWARASASREAIRVARRPTLSDASSFMSYAGGYDGRAALPPFPPFGRNEDGAFAFTLMRCVPGAFIGRLPLAVLHAPEGTRDYGFSKEGRLGFADFLTTCMSSLEPSPGAHSAEGHYRALGRHLRAIAALPDADYDELLRRLLWTRASFRIQRLLAERRARAGAPARAFRLDRAVEEIQASLLKPELAHCVDLPGPDPRAQAKSLLGRFGELLEAWPDLLAAARRLAAKGRRLSRERVE